MFYILANSLTMFQESIIEFIDTIFIELKINSWNKTFWPVNRELWAHIQKI